MNNELSSRLRFRRQWVILASDGTPPEALWSRRTLPDGRILHLHEDAFLEEHEVDVLSVFVLGIAIHPDDEPGVHWMTRVRCLESLEREVMDLCGQYVVIAASASETTLFTDPGAMQGVYFTRDAAASSPNLLPGVERDRTVDQQYPLSGTDDWYTGSRCPFVGVGFLMANHRLDLGTGSVRRFWSPAAGDPLDRAQGVAICTDLLRQTVQKLVGRGSVLLSLTGGKDSRVNLAAAKDVLPRLKVFTLHSRGVKPCDREIPAELAARFGFPHVEIEIPAPDLELTRLYDEISGGMALGARRDILGACLRLAGKDVIHLNGNLGAITKSFFWPNRNPKSVDPEALLKEFSNKAPILREGVHEWLESLPKDLPAVMVYNLMYLEQRGGRWMGPGENASSLFYASFSLFNSRRMFETINRMPPEIQYGGGLLKDFAASLWPEAGAHRYCRNTRNITTFLPRGLKSKLKSLRATARRR